MRKLAAIAVAIGLIAPVAANAAARKNYALKHPRHEHCKARYARKHEKRHRRHITLCVPKAKPKDTKAPTQPSQTSNPGTSTPARTVHLHAHLDPSFVQSPTNPLAVTYSYSASATETIGVSLDEAAAASLPEGFLQLYSNGSLACSVNVGGAVSGGECPVTYTSTGIQQVIVTYTSGSTSATETYTEQIEPYTTDVSDGIGGPLNCESSGGYDACEYSVDATVTNLAPFDSTVSFQGPSYMRLGTGEVVETGCTLRFSVSVSGLPVTVRLASDHAGGSEGSSVWVEGKQASQCEYRVASWAMTAFYTPEAAGWKPSHSASEALVP